MLPQRVLKTPGRELERGRQEDVLEEIELAGEIDARAVRRAAVGSRGNEGFRLQGGQRVELRLGAPVVQPGALVLREARRGALAGVVAGFGGVISEVGAVMMVGGNIQGSTRVMTTAIVLETRKGEFGTALALGLILVGIAAIVNAMLTVLQHGGARYERQA